MKIDKEIFREMVKFYGEAFHLPPLAAKIYSYLIFDFDRNGVSFDEFVEIFCASKSSISSNLNLLLNLNIITDFNKIDERKRFFMMNEKYMKLRFEEIIEKMEKELLILNQLKDFRNTGDEEALRKFEIYTSLFKKNITNIKDSLDQL
ncbi:transcriptional regulator [Kaistella flava (ex Peng et al. 2021)]|uniref:Transcriptional regulator n=1 Tax=Kaistella flava (ex Peng et al. 2021) TaxID=2038776 RepID=A0A7M2YAT9_9FLAO|nr:transcriptional regulator [Kaistella flava (ex Peng et al. 2021)]QOW10949.1 transcriptional regulator [Kaistella flava (ex Peng et al. 2021)]